MTMTSARHALPLLQAGQAQKELYHNEALALLDLALHAVVQEVGRNDRPKPPKWGRHGSLALRRSEHGWDPRGASPA